MGLIALSERPSILVIALRRLGDVLLTTPLIRSLRCAFPNAAIDALVFTETEGILVGNPDIDKIIAMPSRPSAMRSFILGARLFRKYDLAISTQSGDRPVGFAVMAGRNRVAPIENSLNGYLKRMWLHRHVPVVQGVHRVEQMLRLADVLGIPRIEGIVPPSMKFTEGMPLGDYAVIHAAPMYRYKQWTKNGWREVATALISQGLNVVATGGPAKAERHYLDEVWERTGVIRLDSLLDWQQLVGLLSKARVYVGPDTSVTHLAAATGCPTVALYGPTDPRLWGPWVTDRLDHNWTAAGSVQRRGNVWLVQNALPCTPCQLEGCERRLESYSACLDGLAPQTVISAIKQALAVPSVA
jgi:heptosyltransferase III